MYKGYEYVAGPKAAIGSNQLFYLESYTGLEEDDELNN